MGQRASPDPETSLSIQVRSIVMRVLYDIALQPDLADTHHVIRYRRHKNAKWESLTYKYSDYNTVKSDALQYVKNLNHLREFELYVFQINNGYHTTLDAYHPEAS